MELTSKDRNKLIQEYLVAWHFCGEKTAPKIAIAKQLAEKLKKCCTY